jgi:hypothetical protein
MIRRVLNKVIRELKQVLRNIKSRKLRRVPKERYAEFTINGKIPVINQFRDDSYSPNKPLVFSKRYIESLIRKFEAGKQNYYGITDTFLFNALSKYSDNISNKEGVDMGSVTGWYSAAALAFNAKRSYIIEYNKIISEHPSVLPILKKDFDMSPRKFDFATSISSFEHDGLGRYGDPINPIGDLIAMKQLKKIVKRGGLLFLSVPIGKDTLIWNLHRVYGKLRFPLLIEGWKLIDMFGFNEMDFRRSYKNTIQPVFVLKNL